MHVWPLDQRGVSLLITIHMLTVDVLGDIGGDVACGVALAGSISFQSKRE